MTFGRVLVHSAGFVWLGMFLALLGFWMAIWWAAFN